LSSRRLPDNLELQPGRHVFPLALGHHPPSPFAARSTKAIPQAGGARAMPLAPAGDEEVRSRRSADLVSVDLFGMTLILWHREGLRWKPCR
jgi:hypothetical protein